MRRSYYKTLFVSEVQRLFPFTAKIKNRAAQKFAWIVLGTIISMSILYKAARFTIPYAELVLTERCNLRCAGCSNLMPLYHSPAHMDLDTLLASLDAMLEVSGGIGELALLGGEPFVYPRLPEVIAYAVSNAKLERVKIITNGSFIPKPDVLESLRHSKVYVAVSEYNPEICAGLAEALSELGITFGLHRFDSWSDYGGVDKRGLSGQKLYRSYAGCASVKCKTIYRGLLFACPRAAHLAGLGIIGNTSDSVDLINAPAKQRRKKIRELYSAPYVNACDYCNPVWDRPPIKAGIQL